MTRIAVRTAVRSDVADITAMMSALALQQETADAVSSADMVDDILFGSGKRAIALLAETPEGIAGYALLLDAYESSFSSPGLYVSDLYVRPEYRRRGVASALMRAAARVSRESGGQHLWWVAKPDNEVTDRFYRSIATIRDPVIAYAVAGEKYEDLANAGVGDEVQRKAL